MKDAYPTEEDMRELSEKCPKLESLKVNVLRTSSVGSVEWSKDEARWRGGLTDPTNARPSPQDAPPIGAVGGSLP